jgi:hypothetical protein
LTETNNNSENILFLLAAPRGAGKSTLLKMGFERLGQLVGPNLQDKFLETNLDRDRLEYSNFEVARNKQSYFHAIHVPLLRLEETASRSYLIHLDTYNILRNLAVNPDYLTNQQRIELINRKISLSEKRQDLDLLDKRTNDFVLKNFLNDPFFQRFERLVNINLHCDYERHQYQLLTRNGEFGFGHPDSSAPKIQSEIYDCWKRNIANLEPLASFDVVLGPEGYDILHSKT